MLILGPIVVAFTIILLRIVARSCDSTVPSPARFYSLTTWRCEKGAEWVDCGAMQFIDFVMIDNEEAGLDLKLVKGTPWGEERGALVKDVVVAGHADIDDEDFETRVAIVSFCLEILKKG